MTSSSLPSRPRCVSCDADLTADTCSRCGRPRVLPIDYLSNIEDLARHIVEAAVQEKAFNVFSDDHAGKTPLQRAISVTAMELLYWHYSGDGCIDHEKAGTTKDPAELQRVLLDALDRIRSETLRKNWGVETPSPGKLIREGLAIARRCIQAVALTEPDYIEAVLRSLEAARKQQDACGISDDGWRDENGYILSGIRDACREAEKLRAP